MAKRRDWVFRSVLGCCVLVWSTALLLFSQHFLKSLFPVNLQIAESTQLSWLQGWDAVVLGSFLLIIAFLLYAAARQRALSNDQVRPSAGCPSCQKSKLIRVSRHSSDRLLALSFIPMGRFVCPNCRWEGRRVIRKSNGSDERIKPSDSDGLLNARYINNMDTIFVSAVKAQALKAKEVATQEVERGAAAVEAVEQPAEPPTAKGREKAVPFPSGEGYRLTDKWSNHVITIHTKAERDSANLGEVVGTLHVQIWRQPGSETSLQAWLEHITTTVTIYKRAEEINKAQS